MGLTLVKLSSRQLKDTEIFPNRFVTEVCEKFHVHYRNLRLLLSYSDFIEMMKGMAASHDRWVKLGSPEPKPGSHIELCRKQVGRDACNDGIQINLNKNLYPGNDGKIFSEGCKFKDDRYIHLKIRDIRIELSIDDFTTLAESVNEAKSGLDLILSERSVGDAQ
jgi:hypothetical protein